MKIRDITRLFDELGVEMRQGKGSEIVCYANGQKTIIGGHAGSEHSPITVAKVLRRLGIPKDDWPLSMGGKGSKRMRRAVAEALAAEECEAAAPVNGHAPEPAPEPIPAPAPEPAPIPEPMEPVSVDTEPEQAEEPAAPVEVDWMVEVRKIPIAALRAELERRESLGAALAAELQKLEAQAAKLRERLDELGWNGADGNSAPAPRKRVMRRASSNTLRDVLIAVTHLGGQYRVPALAEKALAAGYQTSSPASLGMSVSSMLTKDTEHWERVQKGLYKRIA